MNYITHVIDRMNPGDWEQVRSIFREGIATGYTTFETDVPAWEKPAGVSGLES